MDFREYFYIVASITLTLTSLAIIAIFYTIYRLKQRLDSGIVRLSTIAEHTAKTWGRVTAARLFIRMLKLIF